MGVKIVPQSENHVVERFGKYTDDFFLNKIDMIVKEIYKQLFIYRQLGGIRTMEYTRTLYDI